MSEQLGDVIHITTADGNELFFTGETVRLLAYGNLGAPPTEFITRKGYKQNGVTEVDYLLQPRTIAVQLYHAAGCDRQDYWDTRLALHEYLRPNRGGQLTFTLRTPNGDLRSIKLRADPGLEFPITSPAENDWFIDEQFQFIAFDPLFYDDAAIDVTLSAATQLQLIFPIIFPITFGTSDEFLTTGNIVYPGTWRTYPTITLTGPYTRAVIQNVTLGITLYMSVAIAAGEQRIITLTPGQQSIVDQDGNNKFSDLGVGANLVDFAIYPEPEVANGTQEITVQMIDGVSGQSAATISYYNRYFAL